MSKSIPSSIYSRAKDSSLSSIPDIMLSGKDVYLFDEHGHRYYDFSMGKNSVTLGHGFEELHKKIVEVSSQGQQLTFVPKSYEKLAEKLLNTIKLDLDKAVFLKNGSDAVRLAIRIARSYTGRELVLTSGYHSWHDEFIDENWPKSGVSRQTRKSIFNFYYNDQKLDQFLEEYRDKIAAVIITPEPEIISKEKIQAFAKKCKGHGIVFIMDEVKCGYHLSLGGFSEMHELVPDLLLLSKGMGNGYPISALLGLEKLMDEVDKSIFYGTYFYDHWGIEIATTVLDLYEKYSVIEHINNLGSYFSTELETIFNREGLPFSVVGKHSQFIIACDDDFAISYFFEEMFKKGIYIPVNDNIGLSLSHTSAMIKQCLESVDDVCKNLAKQNRDFVLCQNKKLFQRKMIKAD